MGAKLIKKDSEFAEVLSIIRAGRAKAYEAVNVALIDTYWAVGEHLSRKVAEAAWGKGVVKELAEWLLTRSPDLKGFSASNLWRMKQFYETYADSPKTRTTGASFAMDAQPADSRAEQAFRRTRILPEARRQGAVEQARACPADRSRRRNRHSQALWSIIFGHDPLLRHRSPLRVQGRPWRCIAWMIFSKRFHFGSGDGSVVITYPRSGCITTSDCSSISKRSEPVIPLLLVHRRTGKSMPWFLNSLQMDDALHAKLTARTSGRPKIRKRVRCKLRATGRVRAYRRHKANAVPCYTHPQGRIRRIRIQFAPAAG